MSHRAKDYRSEMGFLDCFDNIFFNLRRCFSGDLLIETIHLFADYWYSLIWRTGRLL